MPRKPKYTITMETAPSNKYKTKEVQDMIIKKGTDIIVNYFVRELNKMEQDSKKTTD